MGAVRRPWRLGGSIGLDPLATRRIVDAAAYLLAFATFLQLADTEILLHAMWVTLAIGAFVYGVRTAVARIAIAATIAIGYSIAASSVGRPLDTEPFGIEPLDFAEWPLMIVISLLIAVMADLISTSSKRYAALYRQASDRLHTAHEDERARLARDLHDGVGQTLTAVVLTLDAAEAALAEGPEPPSSRAETSIRRAKTMAMSALDETRDVAAQLRPTRIHEIGLGAALRNLADSAGVPIDLRLDPEALPPGLLDPDREIDTYRIAQEAVGNAARHSRASHAWIDGGVVDGARMRLEIGDDGVGFDESVRGRGLGLDGMRERATLLDGQLDVRSQPGSGTTVELVVPLPRPTVPGLRSVRPASDAVG